MSGSSTSSSPPRYNYMKASKKKKAPTAVSPDPNYQVTSFREIPFESEEMKRLLSMSVPDFVEKKGPNARYDSNALMPDWILSNPEWRSTRLEASDNNLISDILQIPFSGRSQEQSTILAKWLMSVWEIANTMGFKRCIMMSEAMQYNVYEPSQHIVTEGDRGLVFYIIVSGTSNVHKEGIGNVAQLTKGQSFGELALTQGKDLRTASVVAHTKTEVLCLHKRDYDHFVRDIQLGERRENFAAIKQCKLFEHWTRNKIERMCNTARRETFPEGKYVFRQGDPPDNLYLVVEGTLHAVRSIETVVTNRWPSGMNAWQTVSKKHVKSVFVKELVKGDYFGELSIIKNDVRRANVIAKSRCVLLTIDKLDFLHLLRHRNAIKSVLDSAEEYAEVNRAVDNGSADDSSVGSAGSQRHRKLSLKFKSAVSKAVMTEGKKKVNILTAARELSQTTRPPPSPKKKLTRDGTIVRMTKSTSRLVKHDENETVQLFREQLGNMERNSTPRATPRAADHLGADSAQRPCTATQRQVDTSWRKQSAFGHQFPKGLSFNKHDEGRPWTAQMASQSSMDPHATDDDRPVVFSPITDLGAINEEKAKNKVLLNLPRDETAKPLNVSVTSVLDVSTTGRRQRSVCVKNVKDLVSQTQQLWLHEAATSPSTTGSQFRRQSSLGLLTAAETDTGPGASPGLSLLDAGGGRSGSRPGSPHAALAERFAKSRHGSKVFSPAAMGLQRRMSSFAEAQEDVVKDDATGEIHFKKMKKVPPEFQKPINDRAKLTFYEIMSEKNHDEDNHAHLPVIGSPGDDNKTLFSSASSRRSSSMTGRPNSSPNRRKSKM